MELLKMKKFIKFFKDEEGATAVEYAIMVALIAIVIVAMVYIVGKKANNAFSSVASGLTT
jgi:pilus assembly protein Flp/PilA